MKAVFNLFPDAKANLPKHLFLLSTHPLHHINRLLKELLRPLSHYPPDHNDNRLRHQHRVKLIPNQLADAKVNLPKRLFLLSVRPLHLINRLLKELLHPPRQYLPNHNSSRLRHQQCVAVLTRMVIPSLPNPFAKAKVNLPKCLFLLQIHTHNTFHHTNRRGSLLKQLFILHHLIHCHRLNNQESTEVP